MHMLFERQLNIKSFMKTEIYLIDHNVCSSLGHENRINILFILLLHINNKIVLEIFPRNQNEYRIRSMMSRTEVEMN